MNKPTFSRLIFIFLVKSTFFRLQNVKRRSILEKKAGRIRAGCQNTLLKRTDNACQLADVEKAEQRICSCWLPNRYNDYCMRAGGIVMLVVLAVEIRYERYTSFLALSL